MLQETAWLDNGHSFMFQKLQFVKQISHHFKKILTRRISLVWSLIPLPISWQNGMSNNNWPHSIQHSILNSAHQVCVAVSMWCWVFASFFILFYRFNSHANFWHGFDIWYKAFDISKLKLTIYISVFSGKGVSNKNYPECHSILWYVAHCYGYSLCYIKINFNFNLIPK